MALSLADVRFNIDPILTNIALGYTFPEFAFQGLAPIVPVNSSSGQVFRFGREQARTYDTLRAPGADVRRIDIVMPTRTRFDLEIHSLDAKIPREWQVDANGNPAIPALDFQALAVETEQRALGLELERRVAALFGDPANYPSSHKLALSGTTQWSHASSLPINDVVAAQNMIRAYTGRMANTLFLSWKAFTALSSNPQVLSRFAPGELRNIPAGTPGAVTAGQLAQLFGVERVVIGGAVMEDPTAPSGAMLDVWGNVAILAIVNTGVGPGGMGAGLMARAQPALGYVYRMQGFPRVEPIEYERKNKSWICGVEDQWQPWLAWPEAGFIWSNVSA